MTINRLIGLLKSSWDWSGRFSRGQYLNILVVLILLRIASTLLLTITEPYLPNPSEAGDLVIFLVVLFTVFVFIGNWLVFLTGLGATIRRFHDMDMSGWYVLLMIIIGVGVTAYEKAISMDILETREILVLGLVVILLVGFLLWFFLLLVFGKGKLIGETRWG